MEKPQLDTLYGKDTWKDYDAELNEWLVKNGISPIAARGYTGPRPWVPEPEKRKVMEVGDKLDAGGKITMAGKQEKNLGNNSERSRST